MKNNENQESFDEKFDEEAFQELVNSSFSKEIDEKVKKSSINLHNKFLKWFYKKFPNFYKYIFESWEWYMMEDYGIWELVAFNITWTILRYIEKLIKNDQIDEVISILNYLEQWSYSDDDDIQFLISDFIDISYIIPDVLDRLVKLLPPWLYSIFMKYNSDLL